ncbi:hypothetical protein Ancab_032912 [Ancistrocladus abbreviatus]
MSLAKVVFACIVLALVAGKTEGGTACLEWCVAKETATPETLEESFDFFCTHGVDCTPVHAGGPCHQPSNRRAELSWVFNEHYQHTKVAGGRCDYGGGPGGSSMLTNVDPSYGSCKFTCKAA